MSMQKFQVEISAKVNLSLAITGKRGSLHTLDMIVYPYEKLKDEIVFIPDDCSGLSRLKASGYDGFDEGRFERENRDKIGGILTHFGVGGSVEITKNIPLGAGLGGSSAVYAGVVKAVEKYNKSVGKKMPLDVGFLLSLGSDVPCVLYGKACRVLGVGEEIRPLENVPDLNIDVVIAKGGADSGKCYKIYDELGRVNNCPPPTSIEEALRVKRNDLFEASCIVNPNIKAEYDKLVEQGYVFVLMSGSGSALVYGG